MNSKFFILFALVGAFVARDSWALTDSVVVDNGVVRRELMFVDNRLTCKAFTLKTFGVQFVAEQTPEFSLRIDDVQYSGLSAWSGLSSRDTSTATGGKGVILALENTDKQFVVEIIYLLYPDLPVVHKQLRVINKGVSDIKVEAVDVENFRVNWSRNDTPTYTWTLRQYARYKQFGTYVGNCDDPLVIVHNHYRNCGIAVGNEAIGVMKRTAVFDDGFSIVAGLTHPEQSLPFRKWLRKGECYDSPRVFTALYANETDASKVLNITVPDFVRRHVGIRIEQLPRKSVFGYNTWIPFTRNINDGLVRELAKAASECGAEWFCIDDGWQTGESAVKVGGNVKADNDWEIDRKKFPDGLRPVCDYIKSLGMRPGLWFSLAFADPERKDYKEHQDWFVTDRNGQLTNLHIAGMTNKTACMGTGWYDYIKDVILQMVKEYGIAYIKLDLAIVTSAYVYDDAQTGCYSPSHPYHRDHAESLEVLYRRTMQLFDELHREAPELFIDCTYETAGKLHLMDYGIARHAEGNWLSNVDQTSPMGPLRVRNLAWGRTPAVPATSLEIGNLLMDVPLHRLNFKSLAGTLPVMMGDPRKLSPEERLWYKTWSAWLRRLEDTHRFMSFRQDLPGFGEPAEGSWDGFSRVNTETGSGGLIGVFRHGSAEETRTVTVPWLHADKQYVITQGAEGKEVATMTGAELATKGFTVKLSEKYDGELFELRSY